MSKLPKDVQDDCLLRIAHYQDMVKLAAQHEQFRAAACYERLGKRIRAFLVRQGYAHILPDHEQRRSA